MHQVNSKTSPKNLPRLTTEIDSSSSSAIVGAAGFDGTNFWVLCFSVIFYCMTANPTAVNTGTRALEIVEKYQRVLDQHIDDLRHGRAEKTFEIQDLAELLHIHPTHLSNTLHQTLGQSPCDLYENRLLALAKELLEDTHKPVGDIARQLYYDPSNFTKFFKAYTGITPKQYRQNLQV